MPTVKFRPPPSYHSLHVPPYHCLRSVITSSATIPSVVADNTNNSPVNSSYNTSSLSINYTYLPPHNDKSPVDDVVDGDSRVDDLLGKYLPQKTKSMDGSQDNLFPTALIIDSIANPFEQKESSPKDKSVLDNALWRRTKEAIQLLRWLVEKQRQNNDIVVTVIRFKEHRKSSASIFLEQ
ncbi:hypothetical protein L1987_16654 [Smallanthus sonchifolius]|uniref:Uncharacterized protein n=1 Tax=Smallanthus sonchifolius TaxID=185202 RepID=A0ACB9IVS9_9ASTR|nr:hypothetical protein L1987_16654 [Smallanthus sonchifolius]